MRDLNAFAVPAAERLSVNKCFYSKVELSSGKHLQYGEIIMASCMKRERLSILTGLSTALKVLFFFMRSV
jgi:hypothetical protein